MSLDGRVAVVTGGTKGLGRGIVEALSAEGCRVVCAGRDAAGVADLVGEDAVFHEVDVRDAGSATALMAAARDRFGRIDVLVANAGISHPGPVAAADPERWADVVATNVLGTFHCVRAVVPHLEEAGGGRIITMSSALATRVAAGASAYSASKAAVEAFTKVCAVELAGRGITVNCLAPGFIGTGMGARLAADDRVWPHYERKLALGRLGRADEVARAAVFLAGPDSSYVNGHVLEVNGGLIW
ncbi:SDR family NAD(P)-dependent oxidoreductase [Actinosynnema sp. NPDC023658]|uniref:SDR family NAD(P)-dependent oxidoreductase n=1 Tax=Actinosynnema sp. NPDC023658 TaxID=3155465 RepID=UPI0033D84913